MAAPSTFPSDGDSPSDTVLRELVEDPGNAAVLRYLLAHDEATIAELTSAVAGAETTGEVTDHDRVRAAINLQTVYLPTLEDEELIECAGDCVELSFLPGSVINELSSILL